MMLQTICRKLCKIDQAEDNISRWCHIKVNNNMADIDSRGRKLEEMQGKREWFQGPKRHKDKIERWPLSVK